MSFDNILKQVSKRSSRNGGAQSKKDDTDAVSFRFRRGSKDMFEELVEVGKTNKEAPKEKTNKEKKRKTSEGGEGGKKSKYPNCIAISQGNDCRGHTSPTLNFVDSSFRQTVASCPLCIEEIRL